MYLTDLFTLFVETVMIVEGVDASNYNSSRRKARLKKRFPQLILHACVGRNNEEIVLNENLEARDVLGTNVEKMIVDEDEDDIQFELMPANVQENILQKLFSAAMKIKSLLENCPGLQAE